MADSHKITISELAKRMGVSEATISRALNDSPRVKQTTKDKIQKLAKELGYYPNILARSMRTNQSKTIGVIISNIANAFFTSVVRAIEDEAAKLNYRTIVINTDENPGTERNAIEMLQGYMVSGFIIASTRRGLDYKPILGNTPAVFIDRMPNNDGDYDTLLVNNADGAKQVVNALIAQGATRIGVISSSVSTAGQERLAGYKAALQDNRLSLDESIIKFSDVQMKNVRQYTSNLLINQACDGLFTADNAILLAAMEEITARKLTGFKLGAFDNEPWFDFFNTPVTAVQQPTIEMGTRAVQLLTTRIDQPEDAGVPELLRLTVNLVKRG